MSLVIKIDEMVYKQVMHWVHKTDAEVSGFGKIIIEDPGVIRVVSAYILPQENTAASTEIDDAALAKLMFDSRKEPGMLNWWWHSHVDMDVFWSGTDRATIDDLSSQGFIAASVFNKRDEVLSAFSMGKPVRMPFIAEAETRIMREVDPALIAQWNADFDANVKIKTWDRDTKGEFAREGPDVYGSGSAWLPKSKQLDLSNMDGKGLTIEDGVKQLVAKGLLDPNEEVDADDIIDAMLEVGMIDDDQADDAYLESTDGKSQWADEAEKVQRALRSNNSTAAAVNRGEAG